MEDEINQLLEAERISESIAPKLQSLTPGTCCKHRSWGTGKVKEWDMVLGQLIIDFIGKPGHAMEFEYAASSLKALPDDHIEALIVNDLEGTKELTFKDPGKIMETVVKSLGKFAVAERIQDTLSPVLIEPKDWKKWWDSAKRAMKKDPHFSVPTKRSEPIVLHDAPPDRKALAVDDIKSSVGPRAKIKGLEDLIKNHIKELNGTEDIIAIVQDIDATLAKTPASQQATAVELAFGRDEFVELTKSKDQIGEMALPKFLPADAKKMVNLINALPASKQGRCLMRAKEAYSDQWGVLAWSLLPFANSRLAEVIIESFRQEGRINEVVSALQRLIKERKLNQDFLVWLCKNRKGEFKSLIDVEFFSAMLSVIELEDLGGSRKTTKLEDMLMNEKSLLKDILNEATEEQVRDVTRSILLSTAFEELDKRSLLANLVKLHPHVQDMISGSAEKIKSEAPAKTIVSWESLEKRQAELDEIRTKKIPQTSKEIAIARGYGDLKENHEFKAAKEMMKILTLREQELEVMLSAAEGTDFKGVSTSEVNIGTTVEFQELDNKPESVTILGAWDSDPEKGIISYMTPMAQELLKKEVGETAELPLESGGTREIKVTSIKAYRS